MLTIDIGAFLARLAGRRFVLTVHGVVQAPDRFGGMLSRLYRAWLNWERWIYRRATAVTAVSQAMLDECREIGLLAPLMLVVRVTPHPRPLPATSADAHEWLQSHGLTAGSYVACVGNLVPRKGQDLLLEAVGLIQRVPDRPAGFKVAIAGADPGTGFRSELEKRATTLGLTGTVVFLGRITDAEKDTLYRYCRCAVVPTKYEASPMVAFEALERGLPLVSSDIACLRELLTDGKDAVLFPSEDAAGLANALARVWNDPALSTALRRGAAEKAASFPTWSDLAREYLCILFGRPFPAHG